MYQIKRAYSTNPNLVTRLAGETIGLNDEVRVNVMPTKTTPGFERVIRKATQSDLKALFEAGNPLIEKVFNPARSVDTPILDEMLENSDNQEEIEPKKEKRKKDKQDGELH